jgi:hypothetical protein
MNKRPPSITVISWIFIVVGSIGLLSSLLSVVNTEASHRITDLEAHWMIPVARALALVAGALMLSGFNWGRWLIVVWLAFHVIISLLHSPFELIVHVLLLAVTLYFLFRPPASAYFRKLSS